LNVQAIFLPGLKNYFLKIRIAPFPPGYKDRHAVSTRSAQVFKQMSTNDSTSDPDEPKVSASAIVCEFTTYKLPFGKGRMILDPEAGVIYFIICFLPYGFLSR
jgi:hypothetical protein